ncbi:DUF1036 domain-containing protein [Leptolyngbya sp. FACHB-711]|uniref:DUF1036 domain-containing protein n=1 Tax=Leptolyngbya sp. FACHB-711 TaxID=2692813 RepID=UPI001684DE80|nr:DUF1036 domain-containing protein [Leptolyngbya sp. FACHB-711]MBD2025870.1 DUF1036 domain-containing protein [Leptolyngbya sp. FACHB-711]
MITRKAALTFSLNSLTVLALSAFLFGSQQPAKAGICDWLGICGSEESGSETQSPGPSRSAPASSTTLKLCNKTSSTIYSAYAHWAGNEGWKSQGWYTIQGNGCANLSLGSYSGDVYIYATAANGTYSGRDANFCIQRGSAFTIPSSDRSSCNGSGQTRVGMSRFRLNRGVANTYNFNP